MAIPGGERSLTIQPFRQY